MTIGAPRAEARRREKILAELRQIGDRLAKVSDDHARRVVLFREGNSLGLHHHEMGAACGISESAVSKALKRDASDGS